MAANQAMRKSYLEWGQGESGSNEGIRFHLFFFLISFRSKNVQ